MTGESPGWSNVLALGAVVAVTLLAGMGLGWLIDSAAHTGPTFLLLGLLLGIVGSIAYAVTEFRKYLKK